MVVTKSWPGVCKSKMMAFLMAVVVLCASVAIAGVNEALLLAAGRGDLAEVKRVIAGGAEINAKDHDGDTALMIASWKGHMEVVRELLGKGAEVSAKDDSGKTALMYAYRKDHQEVEELLIKAGAK